MSRGNRPDPEIHRDIGARRSSLDETEEITHGSSSARQPRNQGIIGRRERTWRSEDEDRTDRPLNPGRSLWTSSPSRACTSLNPWQTISSSGTRRSAPASATRDEREADHRRSADDRVDLRQKLLELHEILSGDRCVGIENSTVRELYESVGQDLCQKALLREPEGGREMTSSWSGLCYYSFSRNQRIILFHVSQPKRLVLCRLKSELARNIARPHLVDSVRDFVQKRRKELVPDHGGRNAFNLSLWDLEKTDQLLYPRRLAPLRAADPLNGHRFAWSAPWIIPVLPYELKDLREPEPIVGIHRRSARPRAALWSRSWTR